jgi:magnesium transporter
MAMVQSLSQPISRVTPTPQREHGVVAAAVYAAGRRVADTAIDEAGAWSRKPGHVVWIGAA